MEEHDPRGRTPLMLAVTLGHLECVRLLLRHGCCVTVENKDGWTGNFLLFNVVIMKVYLNFYKNCLDMVYIIYYFYSGFFNFLKNFKHI